jgi:D-lactate dehydrogenase (cytochrome)
MDMATHLIRARAPRGERTGVTLRRDADVVARVLEDAAHFPGGHAAGVASPLTEADIADLLRTSARVLPIGAQSSLTGGATPMGEVVLSLARMNRILAVGEETVRVEAGVTLVDLDGALRRCGKCYPPVPTFTGAFVGGIVSTNAAGAVTFKYGTTRSWVQAMTVILADGDVLDLERGSVRAANGFFELIGTRRRIPIPVPRYQMPAVAKLSAGYFASPQMDLIDLFIGSEGTLGIITEVTLRVLRERPTHCLAFVPFASRTDAMAFVGLLRGSALDTWRTRDGRGLDIAAIEHMDARCLELLREDGVDRQAGVRIPADAAIALLVTLDLRPGASAEAAFEEIGRFEELDGPLARFCRALAAARVLEDVEIAVPGDEQRAAQLLAVREAVPAAVNARVGRAKLEVDAQIAKTAADVIVPFERLAALMDLYDEEFRRRGLDAAVWGHISDGNLHPNVIPRTIADVEAGKDAILQFGRAAIRMGGAPLAEHGVGRNPIKQALLRELYGDDGVEQMRAVKRALDPESKLAPGVLFPVE